MSGSVECLTCLVVSELTRQVSVCRSGFLLGPGLRCRPLGPGSGHSDCVGGTLSVNLWSEPHQTFLLSFGSPDEDLNRPSVRRDLSTKESVEHFCGRVLLVRPFHVSLITFSDSPVKRNVPSALSVFIRLHL